MKNYYKILNVAQTATEEEIKHSFRELAKRYHPDVNSGNAVAARRFANINEAYSVIGNQQSRAEYDVKFNQEILSKQIAAEQQAAQQAANIYRMQNPYMTQVDSLIKAQVQTHFAAVRDKAFKDGYDSGYKNGFSSSEKEIKRLTANVQNAKIETDGLKRKLLIRERIIVDLNNKIKEYEKELKAVEEQRKSLENQLQWLRTAQAEEEAKKAEEEKLQNTEETAQADKADDQKPAEEKADKKEKKAKKPTTPEARAIAWEKKVSNDRQLAKPTLYGALGVVIWATGAEITQSYERLKKRAKAKKNDARVKKLDDAYAVLSDKQKRKEYNESIGITEEKIANERFLIGENKKTFEEYRAKKAPKEFWANYDALQSMALADDADAQNELGEMFYYGKNVKRDFKQAVRWFKIAFEQQHPAAIYHLGVCYTNGEGITKNKTLGEGFLRQASNLGYMGEDLL